MSDLLNLSEKASNSGEWYTQNGQDNDVVLSTRVRLARNLADFPFPQKFKKDDAVRVQTLVFDAFSKCENSDSYKTIALASMEFQGAQLLIERGLIEGSALASPAGGLVMRINGDRPNSGLVCTINDNDHVRISCFEPGLNCDKAYNNCHDIDLTLQKSLQFAASYDFGYLTSSIKDSGSGMKISARVHLPSTAYLGEIGPLFENLASKGIICENAFGAAVTPGTSTGNFYKLSSNFAGTGSEIEQLANFSSAIKNVIDAERRNRDKVLQTRTTEVTDRVLKSFAVEKFALLMDLKEALFVISDLKWGKSLDLVKGIEDSQFTSLLYRIQEGHIRSIIGPGNFNFPIDIAGDRKKQTARLRALLLQDTFEHIQISE